MILKNSAAFRYLFQNGHSVKNEYFSFYFVEKDDLKVGFAATKKCRHKPMRNKLKRIARELWRTNHQRFSLSLHIVVVTSLRVLAVKHEIRENAFRELLSAIKERERADVFTD